MTCIWKGLIQGGSTLARQYLTGNDVLTGVVNSPGVLVYPQGLDDEAMRTSLKALLAHYPIASSRIRRDDKGMLYFEPQDQGAGFEVHRHDHPLPPYGPAYPIDKHLGRYSRIMWPWRVINNPAQPVLEFGVHHFSCGGSLLSMSGVHALCDGTATWLLMMDWIRLHHGHPITPPELNRAPFIDLSTANLERPYTHGAVYQPRLSHTVTMGARFIWQFLTTMEKHVLRVTPQQIALWQKDAQLALPPEQRPTPYELTTAFCIQQLSQANPAPGPRHVGTVTDLRYRRLPGITRKYFGNALWQDMIVLGDQFLLNEPLHNVALACRVPYDSAPMDDVLSYLGLLEKRRLTRSTHRLMSVPGEHCLDNGIFINNCAHLPFYKADFGSGPPTWFENKRAVYRKVMVVSAPPGLGGFDVHLTARRHEVAALKAAQARYNMITQQEQLAA